MGFPVDKCEEFISDLRILGAEFGTALRSDTVCFREEMLGRRHNASCVPALPRDPFGAWKGRGSQREGEAFGRLLRVRNATSGANVRTYKLRSLPNNVLPGLKVGK